MKFTTLLNYPIIAIGDVHGQREELERLVERLEEWPEWDEAALVFLGDYVDRGKDVPGAFDLVIGLLERSAGGCAVMGNHDLALVRAVRLDEGEPSGYWLESYRTRYDHDYTFNGYIGRAPSRAASRWESELEALRESMPERHRRFLASLPWVAEAAGHLFLHCGLSHELEATAPEQVAAMHERCWDRSVSKPIAGTMTDRLWQPEYPVWIGADRSLSARPRPFPGKVQVTGHVRVERPEVNSVRIRLDTSGGYGTLTACLLRSEDAEPLFISSRRENA